MNMQAQAFDQVTIIGQNAEQELLNVLGKSEQQQAARGGLLFQISKLDNPPQADTMMGAIQHLIEDRQAAVYFFEDGDVIIAWSGIQKSVLDGLTKTLYNHFKLTGEEQLHSYYDLNAHSQELQTILKAKLKVIQDRLAQAPAPAAPVEYSFSEEDLQNIKACSKERHTLPQPIVLVVSDQDFTRTTITRMIKDEAMCYEAANHKQAIRLYGELVPNMMFFDVEQDKSMWDLAAYIKQNDPGSFLVAVLGNNFKNEAEKAKEARIQAAVIRPFSKDKLLETVRKYMAGRQK